jgi:hypothetical protein
MSFEGSYDCDADSPSLVNSPSDILKGFTYVVTVAGTFFTAEVEIGDVLISRQDDPTLESHWVIVNKNIEEFPVPDHKDLQNLQGGTTDEYYHITSEQSTNLDELTDGSETELHTHAYTSTNITVVESPTNVEIQSSDGTNDTIAAADTTNAGVMTKAMYDEHVVNNAKTGVTDEISNVVEDTTPQLGGNLDWNSNGNILVGQTVAGSDGGIVYLSGANTWSSTDADAETTSKGMLGIRINSTTVLTHGVYTTTGLTAAATYYLSTTVGAKTITAPSETGDIIRIVGYALSTTEFFFDPDKTYIEVA